MARERPGLMSVNLSYIIRGTSQDLRWMLGIGDAPKSLSNTPNENDCFPAIP